MQRPDLSQWEVYLVLYLQFVEGIINVLSVMVLPNRLTLTAIKTSVNTQHPG